MNALRELQAQNGLADMSVLTGVLNASTGNYTLPDFLREALACMHAELQQKLSKDISEALHYGLVSDETRGIDGLSHLIVYLQYVNSYAARRT